MEDPMTLRPMGEGCACAVTHTPSAYVGNLHHIVPRSWDGPDTPENRVMICPNTHSAVHRLINEYIHANGEPEWKIRRQFGPYARSLAARAWVGRPSEHPPYTLDHH